MNEKQTDVPIRSTCSVAKDLGISDTTLWRWRKYGWLQTVNINGRPFVLMDSLNAFIERAKTGEFSQTKKMPPNCKTPTTNENTN